MRPWSFSAFLGILLASAAPAMAERFKVTVSGIVQQVTGSVALLGNPVAGDSYRLTYIADRSRGVYGGGGGGFGGEVYLLGGTSLDPTTGPPNLQRTPVTALLSVGGHNLSFPGQTYGEMEYVYNSFDIMFGGTGQSWAELVANDVNAMVTTNIYSDRLQTFLVDLTHPLTVTVDGAYVTGLSNFAFVSGGERVSGTLTPLLYSVSAAIPEPASWVLMLAGFTVSGAVLRRKQHRDCV